MPWIEIAVGVGIALLVGLLALVYFADRIGYARGLKQIAAVGAVSIAQAPDGQPIRITGRVRLIDGGLTSPVSQRPCAAWRVEVGQLQRNEHGAWMSDPYEIGEKHRCVDFFLEDTSGVARVDASSVELFMPVTPVAHAGKAEADAICERLEAGEGAVAVREGGGVYKFREGTLDAAERVTVTGVARWEDAPDEPGGAYRGGGRRLVVRAPTDGVVRISDDPEVTR